MTHDARVQDYTSSWRGEHREQYRSERGKARHHVRAAHAGGAVWPHGMGAGADGVRNMINIGCHTIISLTSREWCGIL